MHPATILVAVEEAITKREHSTTRWWFLTYRENKIQCLPLDKFISGELSVGRFSTDTLNAGWTSKQWCEIFSQFFNFFEQKDML